MKAVLYWTGTSAIILLVALLLSLTPPNHQAMGLLLALCLVTGWMAFSVSRGSR